MHAGAQPLGMPCLILPDTFFPSQRAWRSRPLLPQWLRYATAHFGSLRAGSVVTTGSWCGLLLAAPGDAVRVQFDGIGELRVQL